MEEDYCKCDESESRRDRKRRRSRIWRSDACSRWMWRIRQRTGSSRSACESCGYGGT